MLSDLRDARIVPTLSETCGELEMSLDHACAVGRATLSDRGDDLYETPPEAVRSLLREHHIAGPIWEPACGPDAIVRELRAAGHQVVATDLVDYASPDQDAARADFLMERRLRAPVILTAGPVHHRQALAIDQHAGEVTAVQDPRAGVERRAEADLRRISWDR